MQQMSKGYEINNGCETAWTKGTFKTRRTNKKNLYSIITKFTLIHKNITKSSNEIIVCVCVWTRVCACVCVCNTTKLQKESQV